MLIECLEVREGPLRGAVEDLAEDAVETLIDLGRPPGAVSARLALTAAHPGAHGDGERPEQREADEQHPCQHDELQRRHEHAAECSARSTNGQADAVYPSVNCRY
jgi:hypothetical protein